MEELRYDLSLDVPADGLEYRGSVAISATDLPAALALDSVGLTIERVGAGDLPLAFRRDPAGTRVAIEGIPPGTRTIRLDYRGTADDRGVRGFYASPLGAGRLLSTYFEPAAARRFLPCLDRPDAKAVFRLEVTAPADLVVISNTAAERTEPVPDGRRRTCFRPTPPMATYLLYLAIGPLEEIAADGPPRVILAAAPGRAAAGRPALGHATAALAYFARFYDEPYPLAKLHLVAVPQFGTGAMENWGAIAFQDALLLHDERTTARARMRSAEVICHEVAHQWFGDLVTMRWWNDLWLNESFATFVAAKATAALFPTWDPWEEFLTGRFAGAMFWDALPRTHPVRVDVQEPDQVRQIFDDISYGKGASVLRMAEAAVGEEAFRRGVSRYLGEHRWGNAEAPDLWRAVAAETEPGVERMFAEWIDRPGYPVVRARLQDGSLALSQQRFTLGAAAAAPPWPIPLSVRTGQGVERLRFDAAETRLPVDDPAPLVNPGRTGFYRVAYEGELRERLLGRFAELEPVDRWAFAEDALALFLAGATDLDAYLEVLERLATDPAPIAVDSALGGVRALFPLVHRLPRWEAGLRAVLTAQVERLGLRAAPAEPDAVRALRQSVISGRLLLDRPFAEMLAGKYASVDRLEPELVRPVLCATARLAGPAEYRALRERLAHAPTPQAKRSAAAALGHVARDDWLTEGLRGLLSGELFVGPWSDLAIAAVLENPERVEAVRGFLANDLDRLFAILAGTPFPRAILQAAVPAIGLADPAATRAWTESRAFPEAGRAVANGLDVLDVYLRVLERAR